MGTSARYGAQVILQRRQITGNDTHPSEGNDINDLGELVGASQSPAGQYRAMYKSPSTGKNQGWYDLGVLGTGNWSAAYAINNQGLMVGQSTIKVGSSYPKRAFVASNAGNPGSQPMLDLTEQASVHVHIGGGVWEWRPISQYGYVITSAERINPASWIVGYGTFSGQTRAFVLAPRQ